MSSSNDAVKVVDSEVVVEQQKDSVEQPQLAATATPTDQLQQDPASPESGTAKKTIFFSILSKFQSQSDKPDEIVTANVVAATNHVMGDEIKVDLSPPSDSNNNKEDPPPQPPPPSSPSSNEKLSPNRSKATASSKTTTGPDPRKSIDFVEEQTLSTVYHQIPERVVFAKGSGAFGYFQLTSDVLKPWSADGSLFGSGLSKHFTTFVRFSSLNGNRGTPETVRDVHGFSVRFFTDDGNFDLVGTNLPVFFIRNPSLFPSLMRCMKRNPVTNLRDPTAMWNFFASNPESCHALMLLYSDRGLPAGFRFMNGYACHAYKLVNKQTGDTVFAKFTWKTKSGVKTLSPKDADRLAAIAPDHCSHDLYAAIVSGQPPVWELHVQLMTPDQAKKVSFSPFDSTKVWPLRAFPLQLVGVMTVNHNPADFFADVEQVSFNPGNMIPGIEPSPDPMFQTRLSVYPKAALYRLGRNYHQLAVNKESDICRMKCLGNSMSHNVDTSHHNSTGDEADLVYQFDLAYNDDSDSNNFAQSTKFWCNVLDNDGRKRLCANIASDLKDANADVQTRLIQVLSGVNPCFGRNVALELERWDALKGSWTRPDDVPALLSAYFHYGIDQFSISTPNLNALNEDERDEACFSAKAASQCGGRKTKHNKRSHKSSNGEGCRKLRENCHMQ